MDRKKYLMEILQELRQLLAAWVAAEGSVPDERNPFLISWDGYYNPEVFLDQDVLRLMRRLNSFLEEVVDAVLRYNETWRLIVIHRNSAPEGVWLDFVRIDRR